MQLADHSCPRKGRLPRPLPAAATNGRHNRATSCSSVKIEVVPSSTNTCPCYKPHPATVPDRCGAPPLPDDWNSIGDGRIRISVAPWNLAVDHSLESILQTGMFDVPVVCSRSQPLGASVADTSILVHHCSDSVYSFGSSHRSSTWHMWFLECPQD